MERAKLDKVLRGFVFSVLAIIIAAGMRLWPLHSLGLRTVWLTFYPAVMIAALYGGLFAGLFGTVLSCCIVVFAWPLIVAEPFIKDSADFLTLMVFALTCTMISGVAELMRMAQRRAKAANRSKSVFLANMSHELRTPLNAILGFSKLLRDSPDLNAEGKRHLEIINRSGEHLLDLINNVLDLAKMEAGKVALDETPTDLRQVLRDTQSLFEFQARRKMLAFAMEQAPDMPRCVILDQGKLRRILINLVGNAIKFTDAGKVAIRAMGAAPRGGAANRIRFEVEDTGQGISKEDCARLFQPFVQVSAEGDSRTGTGLGLAICKQNVELMGGTIGVASKPAQGSVFFFEVPMVIAPDEAARRMTQSRDIVGVIQGEKAKRILIAEDNSDNRLLLHILLEKSGFEIMEATNGREAVDHAREWQPDLIFMDIRMPVMNGIDAIREIKTDPMTSGIKVIALTAHALEQERFGILAAGCDYFIKKPYRESEIFGALNKYLGMRLRYRGEESAACADEEVCPAPRELESLPLDVLLQLQSAVVLLDSPQCMEIIGTLDSADSTLMERLRRMVESRRYSDLLDAVDMAIKEHGE